MKSFTPNEEVVTPNEDVTEVEYDLITSELQNAIEQIDTILKNAQSSNIQIGKRKEHYPVFTDALVLGNGNSSYAGHGRNW